MFHRLAERFFGIEALTQVDVKDDQRVVGGGDSVEEAVDGSARNNRALGERAEADCACAFSYCFESGGVGDVVPSDVFFYIILGNPGFVEFDLDGAGRVGNGVDVTFDIAFVELFDDFFSETVFANGADNTAVETKLGDMVGEVCGCAAEFFAFGENIPKSFADADDEFIIHGADCLFMILF